MKTTFGLCLGSWFFLTLACAQTPNPPISKPTISPPQPTAQPENGERFTKDYLSDFCMRELLDLPGPYEKQALASVCERIQVLPRCESTNGDPIFHVDKVGKEGEKSKRVFVIALIHGDEIPSGSVARAWLARLERISPRNSWRVIPIASPDGLKARTRTNANKVDLNRNFPSKDWHVEALSRWKTQGRSDPRRYPGPQPASEIETRCLIKHLDDYKPDFVISVHTPLGVLDFDGPKVKNPNFAPLPWVSLGNFPGSLGRYMWVDRGIPVLTIELKGNEGLRKLEQFDALQDITGTIAIQADQILNTETRPGKLPSKGVKK